MINMTAVWYDLGWALLACFLACIIACILDVQPLAGGALWNTFQAGVCAYIWWRHDDTKRRRRRRRDRLARRITAVAGRLKVVEPAKAPS